MEIFGQSLKKVQKRLPRCGYVQQGISAHWLGTASILVCMCGRQGALLLHEPTSVVALHGTPAKLLKVGTEGSADAGQDPGNIVAIRCGGASSPTMI